MLIAVLFPHFLGNFGEFSQHFGNDFTRQSPGSAAASSGVSRGCICDRKHLQQKGSQRVTPKLVG